MSNNVVHEIVPNKKLELIHPDDGLVEFIEALEEIDENSPLAELNAISISDNNGGRIFL